jgi:FMN phosphatase YigB (HAD superfamily)
MMVFFDIDETLINHLDHDAEASRAAGLHSLWLDRTRREEPPGIASIGSLVEICRRLPKRIAA